MSLATGIGFFQLDNLVRNKVPFILLSEDIPFEEIFLGPALRQIQSLVLSFKATDAEDATLEKIRQHPLSKSVPVVVLTHEEKGGEKWSDFLANQGFLNIIALRAVISPSRPKR